MLSLNNIIKIYGSDENKTEALKGINLCFENAEFVSILGQSGCGKTTLLNIIGGLDKYTSGDLIINGVSTKNYKKNDWDAYRNKRIGFVFQSYNLISHLTCLENVELSLTLSGLGINERRKKAEDALKKVGLETQIHKLPNQLSGGQAQRVAIARSLINDPEIILADEPTGSLDSKSSIIVLDILKEISKTKLVIMVTHNKDLAKEYSDRIITMNDGTIVSDTKNLNKEVEELSDEKPGKSSMSFLTAISLSWKNIRTKKARTIMSVLASSIGIIGVGLVLALSNGFQTYVSRVETQSASNMPITISASTTIYEKNDDYVEDEKFPETSEIKIYDPSNTEKTSVYRINNLTDEYISYLDNINNNKTYKGSIAAKIINYTNINHNIYAHNATTHTATDSYSKLNPYKNVSYDMSSAIASVTGAPRSIFHEMYGEKDYILNSYDMLYGTYPDNDMKIETDSKGNQVGVFETALVLDSYNRIGNSTLKNLGFYSSEEVDYMVKNKINIKFSDFVGKDYTFYVNDDIYNDDCSAEFAKEDSTQQTIEIKDENGNIQTYTFPFKIKTNKKQYRYPSSDDYEDLYNGSFKDQNDRVVKSYKIKVTSILRVKKDAFVDYMPASLCYTKGFKDFIYSSNGASTIADNALGNVYVDNLQSLFDCYNTTNMFPILKLLGIIDSDTEVPAWASALPECDATDLTNAFNASAKFYSPYGNYDSITKSLNENDYDYSYNDYVSLCTQSGSVFKLTDKMTKFSELLSNFIKSTSTIDRLVALAKIKSFYNDNPNIVGEYWSYAASRLTNYSKITNVVIFPSSITAKKDVKDYLNEYNVGKTDADKVLYTDIVGEFTDSLYGILSIISIVLVAFSSISLLVSSIMSGIVTYASVVERTKEIGIMRAIGARKKDISRLFIMENCIIGCFSGLVGVVLVYLFSIPINIIINNLYVEYNIGSIASLGWLAAIILVLLSILLSLLSALLPANKAANKDPVNALRTE